MTVPREHAVNPRQDPPLPAGPPTVGRVCAVAAPGSAPPVFERQTRPPDDVLVHEGSNRQRLQAAGSRDATWFWLLDEGVVPGPTALEQLLVPLADTGLPRPVLIASRVVGPDGLLHPRSAPWPRSRGEDVMMACQRRLVSLRLVGWGSLLVHRDAFTSHDPPRDDYPSGTDALEWTARILSAGHGYLAPASIATRTEPWNGPDRSELAARVQMILRSGVGGARLWFAIRVAHDAVRDFHARRASGR